MIHNNQYDVIIIGGSYSGLAAAMALGRALKQVLIIDDGKPCNIQTPHSHNFLIQDGKPPKVIAALAKKQVEAYDTISFFQGLAIRGGKVDNGFEIEVQSGEIFFAKKLIFATGIRDILPDIKGMKECWGISLLHCPYCHGYEVKNEKTGIFGNGDVGFELCVLISNWTKDLTLFTNGISTLTNEQKKQLQEHNIKVVETEISKLEHNSGYLQNLLFKDGTKLAVDNIYIRSPFEQHCSIPKDLGCEYTEEGYIKVNALYETTINGISACGDNTTKVRSVANSVAMGTTTGMMLSKKMIIEAF